MNKYKLIINFKEKDEKTLYFDNLTIKRLQLMKSDYILLVYDEFFEKYALLKCDISNDKKEEFLKHINFYN